MKKEVVDLVRDRWIQESKDFLKKEGSLTIKLRVVPGKPVTRFVEVLADGSVKIDISEPAQEGRANKALIQCMAMLLDVSESRIHLKGSKSRRKLMVIS